MDSIMITSEEIFAWLEMFESKSQILLACLLSASTYSNVMRRHSRRKQPRQLVRREVEQKIFLSVEIAFIM
jgi:predicted Fe-S protein YdhL (DUF1289 family)